MYFMGQRDRTFSNFPIVSLLFVGILLGILSNQYPYIAFIIAAIGVGYFIEGQFIRLSLLILVACLGAFYGRIRRPMPLPPDLIERDLAVQMRIRRATLKASKNHRRIYGFGTIEEIAGERKNLEVYFNLSCDGFAPAFPAGQRISAVGRLRETCFGKSAFEKYLANEGIDHILQRGMVLGIERPTLLLHALERIHEICNASLRRGLAGQSELGSVYRAMMLGTRTELSRQCKDIYGQTGMAHLFAISGLHIGIIGGLLVLLFRCVCPVPVCAIPASLVILFLFVRMTGGSPSAMRAFFMVGCLLLSRLLRRRPNGLAALSFSGFISLLYSPWQVLDTSFQLSYGVVASILLFGLPLGRLLRARIIAHWIGPSKNRVLCILRKCCLLLVSVFGLSLAATVPLIPLSIYHFGRFSLGGIILNPLLMNLATIVIGCGFLSILLGFLHFNFLCTMANGIALGMLSLLHRAAVAFSTLSWIQSQEISLQPPTIILWLGGLFFLMVRRLGLGDDAEALVQVVLLAICPLFWLYFCH